MPKVMQCKKGSIIYFTGDKDDRIFLLQKGLVVLTSADIETGGEAQENVSSGGFFGVKSAFGRFPREETAAVLSDSTVIVMTLPEFEKVFSGNTRLILTMLRVFSQQLRAIHRKVETVLKSAKTVDQAAGMLEVAKCYYGIEQYKACSDVCAKLLKHFPEAENGQEAAKLYDDSNLLLSKAAGSAESEPLSPPSLDKDSQAVMKAFSLSGFARFAKEFEAGDVIIAEYEPGDTFFFIQSGSVQLAKCVNGAIKNLDILNAGEMFGEMSILEDSPRSATGIALTKVQVLEFDRQNFNQLITGSPAVALSLLKLFCRRIYDQKRRFRVLGISDFPARIADVFLMFDEMDKSLKTNDRMRNFNLTVQDVALWAALPLDIVRNEIDKYVERRKIEVSNNCIVVMNIQDFRRNVDQYLAQRAQDQARHVKR